MQVFVEKYNSCLKENTEKDDEYLEITDDMEARSAGGSRLGVPELRGAV